MMPPLLPLPGHFDPGRVGEIWRVPYQQRALEAAAWARQHAVAPACQDQFRLGLLLVDCQNTFCLPDFELYVGGPTGQGPLEDNRRLCAFIYRHLGRITEIIATLDTHQALQIFHSMFLVNDAGQSPPPLTSISEQDLAEGRWKVNPAAAAALGIDGASLQRHLLHYCRQLRQGGKYQLMIWPYHAMLGGIGHALVSAVEEAIFFHGQARRCANRLEIKGTHPLVESYSVLRPEVLEGADGQPLAAKNTALIDRLLSFDALLIAGQAKSHCVAWTVEDLLSEIQARDPRLAGKIYLLEDCTSPVVIAGGVDFSKQADAAFARFAQAGMHVVRSTEAIESWPGFPA